MTGLEQVTGPVVEPLTLAEVKDSLKIDGDEDDAVVTRLMTVARQRCEQFTGRIMNAQRWRLTLDRWPGAVVALPLPPLIAVEAVSIYAADGSATAVAADVYGVDTGGTPGRIALCPGAVWPVPGRRYNGIEILFQAGFGASWNDVPETLRQGMLMLVAALYEDREGRAADLPPAVVALWSSFRLVRL